MITTVLDSGDPVFHPKYGFGTINGRIMRDPSRPLQDTASGPVQDYYDIELLEGGTLLVPVSRAESLGLRRLSNGVEAIQSCLSSPAQDLPANTRDRVAVLRERGQTAEPTALAEAVRDLCVYRRGRSLSAGEKTWLDKSCEYLTSEAALVDRISKTQARAAIWEAVNRLNSG